MLISEKQVMQLMQIVNIYKTTLMLMIEKGMATGNPKAAIGEINSILEGIAMQQSSEPREIE